MKKDLLKSRSFFGAGDRADSHATLAVAGKDLYVPFATQKMDDGSTPNSSENK